MIEATESTMAICQYSGCGNTIEQVGGRGHRLRNFCSDRCRQRHHREEEERQRLEAMAALERQVKELQERLNVEERFRTDIEVRHFKNWLRKHPQARDTDFFKRFLADTRLPQHASRAMYMQHLRTYRYSEGDITLFEEAWKDMLFQS